MTHSMTLLLAAASAPIDSGWLPPAASSSASKVDLIFWIVFWLCAFFFGLIAVATAVFVYKYRAGRVSGPQPSPDHNTTLELVWSGIPLLLCFGLFWLSAQTWLDLTEPPANEPSVDINVTAKKWSWWFDYPGGKGAAELHVLAGKPVRLTMAAQDVLHSLFIPAFRLKQDLVPGRYTRMWFRPTEPGTYPIYCAEYCGRDHSEMRSTVVVHPDQASYDAWLKEGDETGLSLVEVGQRVYSTRGCAACHSIDGTTGPGRGPSFKGIWGKTESFADGKSGVVDEAYIRESILDPRAKTVNGFLPIMPPTPLEERQILGVIEYLKSLK